MVPRMRPPLPLPSCVGSSRRADHPVTPLQVGREPPWLLLALGPGHSHSARQRSHTQLTQGAQMHAHMQNAHGVGPHARREPAEDGHVLVHTRAQPELSQDICVHAHTRKSSHRFDVRLGTHSSHRMYVYMCVYIHRGPTQRPRLSLNKERPPGMLVSPLFLSPVKQPGLHRTLHFALALPSSCPLSLSTQTPPPQPPSFLPG